MLKLLITDVRFANELTRKIWSLRPGKWVLDELPEERLQRQSRLQSIITTPSVAIPFDHYH